MGMSHCILHREARTHCICTEEREARTNANDQLVSVCLSFFSVPLRVFKFWERHVDYKPLLASSLLCCCAVILLLLLLLCRPHYYYYCYFYLLFFSYFFNTL